MIKEQMQPKLKELACTTNQIHSKIAKSVKLSEFATKTGHSVGNLVQILVRDQSLIQTRPNTMF